MSIIDELKEILSDHELDVKAKGSELMGIHKTLPIAIVVSIDDDNLSVNIEIKALDELEDAMSEVIESGEDLRSVVDEVLSELRDIAIEISRILETKGYRVALNIREGESDVRDLMEDVIEEYEEIVGGE